MVKYYVFVTRNEDGTLNFIRTVSWSLAQELKKVVNYIGYFSCYDKMAIFKGKLITGQEWLKQHKEVV